MNTFIIYEIKTLIDLIALGGEKNSWSIFEQKFFSSLEGTEYQIIHGNQLSTSSIESLTGKKVGLVFFNCALEGRCFSIYLFESGLVKDIQENNTNLAQTRIVAFEKSPSDIDIGEREFVIWFVNDNEVFFANY